MTSSSSAFERPKLRVRKLHEHAVMPSKPTAASAGYDVASCVEVNIQPKCRMLIKTGLSIAIPHGTYARVAPRSGLALKCGIDVMAGVIDSDYRGEVGVVLVNLGTAPFEVKVGDRIAQLILEKIETNADVVEVSAEEAVASGFHATERGGNGFGSSGVATSADPNE